MHKLLILLLVVSCSQKPLHQPEDLNLVFTFVLIPKYESLYLDGVEVKALVYPSGDVCIVEMNMKYYSHGCLGHETDHCIRGYWHDDDWVDCH